MPDSLASNADVRLLFSFLFFVTWLRTFLLSFLGCGSVQGVGSPVGNESSMTQLPKTSG
jgi:hypothetical protein